MGQCPACGAALRPGAPWCTLCYADFRPAPVELPIELPIELPVEPAVAVAAYDPLTDPAPPAPGDVSVEGGPSWPCSSCGSPNSIELSVCGSCGAGFLASIADRAGPTLVLPVIGDVMGLSKSQRMALALGAVLVVVALTLLAGLLLG